ncbi:MAG: hypothetical protein IKA70_02700 [Alistipes sp.]|nr:hypothetical protein [Alistipes sp.]
MRRYDDSEYFDESEEEALERERQEEILRLVRSEVRRIDSGEAAEEMAAEAAREQEATEAEQRRKSRYRWLHYVVSMLTGEILVTEEIKRIYDHLSFIALMFFISIVVLFSALHLDTRRDKLEREVKSIHEKSVRMKERLFRESSHSAIMRRLNERGLELEDPQAPTIVIE